MSDSDENEIVVSTRDNANWKPINQAEILGQWHSQCLQNLDKSVYLVTTKGRAKAPPSPAGGL